MRKAMLVICFAGSVQAGQIDTSTYNGLRRGMEESEVLLRAGEPDMATQVGGGVLAWDDYGSAVIAPGSRIRLHYIPGPDEHDPWITVVTLLNGRVSALERRKVFAPVHAPPPSLEETPPGVDGTPRDDDIRRERAERTLDAAQRYSDVRSRLKAGEARKGASNGRAVYRGIDDSGVPYFGDVPAPAPGDR